MLKLSLYTLYGKRKKAIYFPGQGSNFKVTGPLQRIMALGYGGQDIARTMQSRFLKLSMYTSYERGRSLFIFKVKGQISRSLGLYKDFWHLDLCGQDRARTMQSLC